MKNWRKIWCTANYCKTVKICKNIAAIMFECDLLQSYWMAMHITLTICIAVIISAKIQKILKCIISRLSTWLSTAVTEVLGCCMKNLLHHLKLLESFCFFWILTLFLWGDRVNRNCCENPVCTYIYYNNVFCLRIQRIHLIPQAAL